MPREFRFPSAETRVWIGWQAPPVDNPGGTKTGTIMRAIGRLKPGVTPAQAAAEGTARAIAAPDAGLVAMSLFGAREPIQITVTRRHGSRGRRCSAGHCDPVDRISPAVRHGDCERRQHAAGSRHRAASRADHSRGARRRHRPAGAAVVDRERDCRRASAAWLGFLLAVALHAALPSLLPADSHASMTIAIDGRVLLVTLLLSAITSSPAASCRCCTRAGLKLRARSAMAALASAGAGRGRARVGPRR